MPQQQIKDKYVHWAETLPNIFKMSIICGVKQTILFVRPDTDMEKAWTHGHCPWKFLRIVEISG